MRHLTSWMKQARSLIAPSQPECLFCGRRGRPSPNGPESAYTARAAFHGFAFPGARPADVMWAVPIAAGAMGTYRSGATGVQ